MSDSTLRRIEQHFDNIAEGYYGIVDKVWYEYGYCHQKELAFLKNEVSNGPRRAIDAGCGPGRNTAVLASKADKVTAVDLSRNMLKRARDEVGPGCWDRVDFVQADVRHLPFKARTADLVVNYEVLEHLPHGIPDILDAFKEFRRVLVPRGKLITEVPLVRHLIVNLTAPPNMREISSETRKRYYQDVPLPVADVHRDEDIEELLGQAKFRVHRRCFVRVLPTSIAGRNQRLAKLDEILERLPVVRRFAREVIWCAVAT